MVAGKNGQCRLREKDQPGGVLLDPGQRVIGSHSRGGGRAFLRARRKEDFSYKGRGGKGMTPYRGTLYLTLTDGGGECLISS